MKGGLKVAYLGISIMIHGILLFVLFFLLLSVGQKKNKIVHLHWSSGSVTSEVSDLSGGQNPKVMNSLKAPTQNSDKLTLSTGPKWLILEAVTTDQNLPDSLDESADSLLITNASQKSEEKLKSGNTLETNLSVTAEGPGAAEYTLPDPPSADWLKGGSVEWHLVLSIPPEGGFPSTISGVESGSTELDRWLLQWLGHLTFPQSQDGKPYTLHWVFTVKPSRPW